MIRLLSALALTLTLGACTVGPDYQRPDTTSFLDKWFSSTPKETISEEPISLDWWRIFKDPLLEKYIEEAASHNKDITIALANLRRARAVRAQDTGIYYPELSASGGQSRTKSSGASSNFNSGQIRDNYDAGFDASWEIDIFGGNRRTVEAANARVGSAQAEYQDVILATLSEVARTYYEARGLQKRIAITKENTSLLRATSKLIEERLSAGEATEFDLARAKGEYQLTRARLPNLEGELKVSLFTLATLLGQTPEALLDEMKAVKPLPTPPDLVPVGLRADILRRRPDIRMAERELAASTADIGIETAELFPKFFITGARGTQALRFGDLLSAAADTWSISSLFQWRLFEGGSIRAGIEIETAETEEALASYEKAVLEALRDTETALTRYGQELETRKRLAQGVASRRKAVKLAKQLFDSGEEDYLSVLDSERELTSSEDDLVQSETQTITKLIALYTALGGGWEEFDTTTEPQELKEN